uniref:E3 ubiquitin-protein ligase n=1 Tax=Sphaeramia orbicularis TaxID=375764 RepID=A0A672Z6K4_9TELE
MTFILSPRTVEFLILGGDLPILFSGTIPPGQGWQWEWENDAGTWTAHNRQQTCLDLTPLGFCYLIDYQNMTQVNRQSQRCRRIQRRADMAYPLVSGPLPLPKEAQEGEASLEPCLVSCDVHGCEQMESLWISPQADGGGGSFIHSPTDSPVRIRGQIRTTQRNGSQAASVCLQNICVHQWIVFLCINDSPQFVKVRPVDCTFIPSVTCWNSGKTLNEIVCCSFCSVPTVPVKNLNGSSPVHPALAGITGILMSAAALPVCLTRPPKLVLHPPPVSKSDIKPVPGFGHCCRKTTKKQARKGKTPEEVVKKYLQKVKSPPEEDCTICMEPLVGPSGYKGPGVGPVSRAESVGRLAQCGHQYHFQCLVAMYNNGNKDGSLQCPTCKTIYGVKTGNQPAGKMEYHVIPHSLPGHPDCKTIRIIYNIPPGIQGPEHPNPGKPYTARGFPRHCYLPDSEKGRKVLRLLLVAWDRRLIFSVGTSSTTGESDTVIWNEVHHKTEFGSNLTGHGFPDPGHLDNVLEELRAQGITEDDGLTEK